jgi:hypothetical protein
LRWQTIKNSIKNLWPESHRTSPWNAQVKDRLEGKLHELVCRGQLDLKTAQHAIASNWIEAYQLYVSPNLPFPFPWGATGGRGLKAMAQNKSTSVIGARKKGAEGFGNRGHRAILTVEVRIPVIAHHPNG